MSLNKGLIKIFTNNEMVGVAARFHIDGYALMVGLDPGNEFFGEISGSLYRMVIETTFKCPHLWMVKFAGDPETNVIVSIYVGPCRNIRGKLVCCAGEFEGRVEVSDMTFEYGSGWDLLKMDTRYEIGLHKELYGFVLNVGLNNGVSMLGISAGQGLEDDEVRIWRFSFLFNSVLAPLPNLPNKCRFLS